jgi:hypothetical protein
MIRYPLSVIVLHGLRDVGQEPIPHFRPHPAAGHADQQVRRFGTAQLSMDAGKYLSGQITSDCRCALLRYRRYPWLYFSVIRGIPVLSAVTTVAAAHVHWGARADRWIASLSLPLFLSNPSHFLVVCSQFYAFLAYTATLRNAFKQSRLFKLFIHTLVLTLVTVSPSI